MAIAAQRSTLVASEIAGGSLGACGTGRAHFPRPDDLRTLLPLRTLWRLRRLDECVAVLVMNRPPRQPVCRAADGPDPTQADLVLLPMPELRRLKVPPVQAVGRTESSLPTWLRLRLGVGALRQRRRLGTPVPALMVGSHRTGSAPWDSAPVTRLFLRPPLQCAPDRA